MGTPSLDSMKGQDEYKAIGSRSDEAVFTIQEGSDLKVEIGRAVRINYHNREFIAETLAQASPRKMAKDLGISIKEANKLRIYLLKRLEREDRARFMQQIRIFDLKEALDGLGFDDSVEFLSIFPSGSLIGLLVSSGISFSERMRVGEKAEALAKYMMERGLFRFISLDMDPDRLYVDDNGILREAKGLVNMIARLHLGGLSTREVVNELRDRIFLTSEKVKSNQLNPMRYLALENGILDLQEFRFVSPDDVRDKDGRRHYFTKVLDAYVDPEFIDKVRNGEIELDYFRKGEFLPSIERFYLEEDGKAGINFLMLQDMMGSILAPVSMRLISFIVGPPRTGKTLLLNSVKGALGDLCLSTSLNQLMEDMFTRAEILGSRVIVSSEEISEKKVDVDELKKIVGGDVLAERPIYSTLRQQEENPIKIIVAGNRLPRFSKLDEGSLDRIRIIRTNNPLSPDEADPSLVSKVKEWKNEVIQFMLWNMRRIQLLNYRIADIDPLEKYQLITILSNPLKDYVDTCLARDPNGREYAKDLYEAYLEYAREKGVREIVGRNKFYDYLSDFFTSGYYHKDKVFLGVRIREEWISGRAGSPSSLKMEY
ncbi:MAG: hypothetical protein DSO07_12405 [Thermoproteota archaeon]|nr:MAG: hypothetical protein DSO07_12405 [Candidatus Korarchaeota archaeon]